MNRSIHFLCCAWIFAHVATTAEAETVVHFDDLSGYTNFGSNGNYFDGHGSDASSGSWTTQGVTFNTNQFGPGWSYSNVNDATTAGFTNQFAAITGTDVSGSGNYVIGNSFTPGGAFLNLSLPTQVNSVFVTNATFAALSMRDGDSFAKMFGGVTGDDPDFFRVTFTGHSETDRGGDITGTQEFFLADYRFADNSLDYIVDDWESVDLTALGTVRSISIGLDSTDNGMFGMNTPAYVAIDNLSFTAIPEPTTFAFLAFAGAWTASSRRRNRRNMSAYK
ncbi:MAG: DUF4465 domain-containing protein [Planctomycetota bacterium]